VRQHADLAAVMGFVREHVAEHLDAERPGLAPAVAAKILDAGGRSAKCLGKHFGTARAARGQGRTDLLWRAFRADELRRDFQVRGIKADPLGADVVHMSKDGGDGARLAGRFGCPCSWIQVLEQKLVHPLIRSKDLEGCLAESRFDLLRTLA